MSILNSVFKLTIILTVIVAIIIYSKIKPVSGPIVQLKDGKVQGIILDSRGGRKYVGYLGIPFAKPPVGHLRFETPVPSEPWEGVRDGSFPRSICAQFEFSLLGMQLGSEDCLYLSVFTPLNMSSGKKLPVIVHVHGGYFHMSTSQFAGANYFLDHDIIVVIIQYRLGALGFLNTGDNVVKGNMGLKDQRQALRWVKNNAELLGGDSAKVTIIGQSAGAASVQYQILSPSSKDFWRAIRQSGSALNEWTMFRNVKEQSRRFGRKFGCPTDNSKKLAECLRSLDLTTLLEGHRDMMEIPYPAIGKFVPTIEAVKDSDSFLTEEPIDLLTSGRFNKVPVLSGFNADEGLLHSSTILANETKLDQVNDDWPNWAPRAFLYDPLLKNVSQKLRDFYFGSKVRHLNSKDFIKNLTNLYGDRLLTNGIVQSALLERKHVPVYMYFYDHQGGFNTGTHLAFSQAKLHPVIDLLGERLKYLYVTYILRQDYVQPLPGVSHGDEYALLWSGMHEYLYMASADIPLSKDLVKLWVDFASGNEPLKFCTVEVKPTKDPEELALIHIKLDNPKIIKEPFKNRRLFWETLNVPHLN